MCFFKAIQGITDSKRFKQVTSLGPANANPHL